MYGITTNMYILSSSVEATNKLIFEAGAWTNELHEEIWVYDQGYWQKDATLYASVQNSHWEDVILDEGMKKALIEDAEIFFDSQDTYDKLKVPWKRGYVNMMRADASSETSTNPSVQTHLLRSSW